MLDATGRFAQVISFRECVKCLDSGLNFCQAGFHFQPEGRSASFS